MSEQVKAPAGMHPVKFATLIIVSLAGGLLVAAASSAALDPEVLRQLL